MQIKQLDLDSVDIRLEDGKAWQGSVVLLSLENVEAVSGYENLQNLKQKHAELESRYYTAKTRHAENPDDLDAYEAFFEASKQRNEAIQEMRDIEAQLYHMMEGMYEQTSRGKLTARLKEVCSQNGYKPPYVVSPVVFLKIKIFLSEIILDTTS